MNDLDTTVKDLINSAVDHELAGRRSAPPLDRSALLERPGATPSRPAHPAAAWGIPVLAASVAAMLAVGTVLAIGHDRDRRATPAAHSASPAPSASRSVNPDQEAAARAYAEAVAGAAPDPSTLAGVSVSAISAADAAPLKNSSALRADASNIANPQPGKAYSFSMSYLSGPGNSIAVVSIELRDVASGSCPQPFLARAAHTYRIRCQVTFLAATIGKATLTARRPAGVSSASVNLTDPAKSSASSSTSPNQGDTAASAYSAAVAGAPEAGEVAGVSDRAATVAERQRPVDSVGSLNHPVTDPQPGRSYPITLLYIPSSDAPPVAVLALRFEGVVAGHCPGAFRVRPAHAYQISCQVTFRAGVKAWAYFDVTRPQGMEPTGLGLFS